MRTGGQILIDALLVNDVDTIFGVPGESYLEALDAIYTHQNRIKFVTCRQEGGSAFMADAWANATGRPGVCFVTRGPGVTNASIGLHTAFQGSTPLLLLIGQVPRPQMERETYQELDYRRILGPLTKWVAQIDQADRIPEFVNRALRVATSGRPGPVALVLPEDMLRERIHVMDLPPVSVVRNAPAADDMTDFRAILARATRPLVILGGSNWSEAGRRAIHAFAESNHLPVATGFRRQSLFDNDHACYVGNLGFGSLQALAEYIPTTDLIIAIGSRLADPTSFKYQYIGAPRPSQKLVHILPGPEDLGRVLTPDLAIMAEPDSFAVAAKKMPPIDSPQWQHICFKLGRAHASALALGPQAGPIDMGVVMACLRRKLPRDAIVTNGAGNFADWPNRFYTYRAHRTVLAPVSGAMGYGVPAAVAAKIAYPQRTVVGFTGDGDFLMNGQEIATAIQYGVAPVILVVNNGSYGTIRMHQENRHPGRVSGTDLRNPDFGHYARAFGGHGEVVTRTEDFEPAFERALNAGVAAIVELRVGPDNLGPDLSLAGLRAAASESR
ncbi:MAG: acetolactate synthase large subunit [Rhodospirillaceae bacterium]|nr:acetolactate synthase large subunit [Rhodospirillaceae bacterium]